MVLDHALRGAETGLPMRCLLFSGAIERMTRVIVPASLLHSALAGQGARRPLLLPSLPGRAVIQWARVI